MLRYRTLIICGNVTNFHLGYCAQFCISIEPSNGLRILINFSLMMEISLIVR